jgi:ATP-dependent DNA helicase RecQ
VLKTVIPQAVALLKGEGLAVEDADEQRERLLAGFRWILVDEYQDVGQDQYDLISALAGRTQQDAERKLSLFAVGDDDQNIYAFAGASVEFIRQFATDYASKPTFLTENYRSTAHIIAAANLVIEPARERMKAGHPISVHRARAKASPGGEWQSRDPVGQGRVQVLRAGGDPMMQALAVMTELQRLSRLEPNWSWTRAAVIAREWKYLEPVRAYCELNSIAAQMADEELPSFWRLRETQALIDWVRGLDKKLVSASGVAEWLAAQPPSPWISLLQEAAGDYGVETGGSELPHDHFFDWLAEWGRDVRRRQTGLMLLTAHRAKGLEFDHVAVLDGGWGQASRGEDQDAPRRLFYVAMTRAKHTLTLACFDRGHTIIDGLPESSAILRRAVTQLPAPPMALARQHARLRLADVDLGFAGRSEPHKPVHRAIASLTTGSALRLELEREKWILRDDKGAIVGRLAASYAPPPGMECNSARVAAVVVWRREDSSEEYQSLHKCDRWEVVVPELVFEPLAQKHG